MEQGKLGERDRKIIEMGKKHEQEAMRLRKQRRELEQSTQAAGTKRHRQQRQLQEA